MIENIENRDIKSFDYEEYGISDGEITGICELGKCFIELFNKNNKYSHIKETWIKTKFGEMYIYDSEPNQADETIKLSCYDARYKLDKEYDKSLYSFPMKLRAYRNAVFNDSGLDYSDEDEFPNEDLIIPSAPYIGENPKNRDAIKVILQAGLSILLKSYEDVFSFGWFNDDDEYELKDCVDLTTDSKETKAINLMILGRGTVEDNVYWPANKPTEEHQFRIDNNYILDDQSTNDIRYNTIQPLYERINGFKYVVYDLRTTFVENKLSIKLGSKIKFYNRNKETVKSYVMNKKITYIGGDINLDKNYEISLSASAISETSTEVKYGTSLKNDLLRVERKADKNAGEISDLIQKNSENSENITKTEQTVSGIKNTVESMEKSVGSLEEIIEEFSVDLETNILTIATGNDKKPLDSKSYSVKYYSYFKGKQVTSSVENNNSNDGIIVTTSETSLTFSVDSTKKITNSNNVFELEFSYMNNGKKYSTTKKITISLALSGENGTAGDSAYDIWKKEGNTGTEAEFIESLKGEDGNSTYVYVKYSPNADGSNMTDSPTDETEYTGISTTASATAPTSPSAYTWQKTVGKDGVGIDGTSSYLHIKWSEDGTTFSGENGKTPARWQGTYVSTSQTDSSEFDDYNWVDTAIHVDKELAKIKDDVLSTENKITLVENDLKQNYLTGEEVKNITNDNSNSIEILKRQFASLETTANEVSIRVGSILSDGVTKVKTATGFTFDENGLDISKDGEEMHNFIDNKGVYVKRDDVEVLGADSDGVRGENVWAKKYLKIGNNSRFEDYNTNRTGVFYVGSD